MTTQPTAPLTRPTKTSPACKDDVIADYCVCCFGDPELVCAACGEHACWAGRLDAACYIRQEIERRGRAGS
jgi:hypothetical protein